jgi:hypothetical protein
MIIALGVMLVTSLLMVAAFTAANGDIHLSHEDLTQKQAYFAALAGVQEYEYKLQNNPNYWQTCEGPSNTVPNEVSERYEVKLLVASTAPKGTTTCSTANPFTSMIESTGTLANTFRIESIGYAGTNKRTVIATFQVTGFLDYVYFTNYEQGDPQLFGSSNSCEEKYYKDWSKLSLKCQSIEFTSGDMVNGPMHTNDSADVGGSATFGREGHNPADVVEINGGTYPSASCTGSAKYYTATKCYSKGITLVPPESDTSLEAYVEPSYHFYGVTRLTLNGSAGTIKAVYFKEGKEVNETLPWPPNGLIYVQESEACGYQYERNNSDNNYEEEHEEGCGNVYVKGTYGKSLTVAGENDLIINGSVYPTSVEGKLGSEPTGTTVLGLIASQYVRIFHECSSNKNGVSLENPWIYAAILSTAHSFVVDNYGCGAELGKLHEYGAIAQNYRGAVGEGSHGYIKDYKYDGRLATDEPPYFLAPLKAGWKIIRETTPGG